MARRRPRLRPRAPRAGGEVPSVFLTGASTGIGRATAELLRDRGWDVYATVRQAGEAPPGTREVILDVTDAAAVERAAAGIEELDALVDNAGIGLAGPLEVLPLDALSRQLEVNVVGQLRVTQTLLPALRRRRGRIVIMGSISGRSALPFLGAYAMSKFALEGMADALRVELAPWGMHVVLVEPGTIATPIWTKPQRSAAELSPQAVELYGERLDRFRRLAAERAAGHAVPAVEVAKVVEQALTAKQPKTRYVVGPDAKRRAQVQKLPTRIRDRVLTRFLFGS